MASEAITKNDLKAILNEVLPPTPSEYKKLLWQNPNPTAAFAAQTVALNLSDYDEVEIEYVDFVQHQDTMAQIRVKIGNHGSMHIMIGNSGYSSGIPFVANRRFLVSLTGVDFEGASGIPTNNSLTSRNDTCIPCYIYGIKYERVAPPQVDALEWKLAGTATGNTNTVTVPSSAQEISVAIEATSGVCYTGTAPIIALKAIWNVSGYYLSSTDIGLCNLNVSNNNRTFQIRNCRYGAGDYKTTAILSVYYR